MLKYEKQYNTLCRRVLEEGVWVENARTGKRCLTVINADLEYDVSAGEIPLLTNKQVFQVSAVAEILGYIRAYDNAKQFEAIGSPTWRNNSDKTQAWLDNPLRKGSGDIGKCYGGIGRDFGGLDLLDKVYNNLRNGIDDRREIVTMLKPDEFHKGCLRPCAYLWHFSLLGDTLYLTVNQASVDIPLGLPFNSFSFYFLLSVMARITGKKAGKVFHKMVNCHIYEDQIEPLKEQLSRKPLNIKPIFKLPCWIECLEDLEYNDVHAREYFKVIGYEHQGKIVFPFSE